MKKIIFYFIFAFNIAYSYEYELALCAIFRDDAPYLKEWIDFHLKQGVEHFFLYDNFSIDNPNEVLNFYIKKNIVEIIPWNISHNDHDDWLVVQNSAYMDCINKHRKTIKWLACLDTDEFLFCTDGKNLKKFLKNYNNYQILLVDWQLYGTSGYEAKDNKIIEHLFLKAPEDYCVWTKAIVKPLYIKTCHFSHYFFCEDQRLCVDENFKPISVFECSQKKPTISKIRINHYFCRDKLFFENVKMKRIELQGRNPKNLIEQEKNCNSVYDDSILKAL